jgi:hypothetical protein
MQDIGEGLDVWIDRDLENWRGYGREFLLWVD